MPNGYVKGLRLKVVQHKDKIRPPDFPSGFTHAWSEPAVLEMLIEKNGEEVWMPVPTVFEEVDDLVESSI